MNMEYNYAVGGYKDYKIPGKTVTVKKCCFCGVDLYYIDDNDWSVTKPVCLKCAKTRLTDAKFGDIPASTLANVMEVFGVSEEDARKLYLTAALNQYGEKNTSA